jgi:hypothetical protein
MGFSAEKTFDIEAGSPLKKNIEKFQVVRRAAHFKQEEWQRNINPEMALNLLAL